MDGFTVDAGGGMAQPVILVTCADRGLLKAMLWLCYELICMQGMDGLWSAEVVAEHIKAWGELLRTGRDITAVGLAGELLVMHDLVAAHGQHAWDWWVGPRGGVHDVVAPEFCIEVKTTAKRHGWQVTMHNLHQAIPAGGLPLFVDCVRLESVHQGGFCLKDLTAGVPAGLMPEAEVERLSASGEMEGVRFRFLEARRFTVDHCFPRIGADHFVAGSLPPRVLSIEYVVDLGGVPSAARSLGSFGKE
ncbi:MAG: PD-(D/E)XK motif protein [Lentisphaerae bacterium]|nr:PD-(D/E)XK motif protein [Lentisphaerota bacterium]